MNIEKFNPELEKFSAALREAKRVLLTAPGAADGDSIGSQLALRRILLSKFPNLQVLIVNDEPLPFRYQFLPDVEHVYTPETYAKTGFEVQFDVAIVVDGGIDRAGRVRPWFEKTKTQVFIDHHAVSANYPYTIKIVEAHAASNTQLIYYISQSKWFQTKITPEIAQQIYLGVVFDTGFFRHSNTTPECMELGADLIRTGFDFTRVGERGMLERTFPALQLFADTLKRVELSKDGRIIWSILSQENLRTFKAEADDREGIIDHLFLTHGVEIAVLFFELPDKSTKISFRSKGSFDVAKFARSLTERGGGHAKASGANIDQGLEKAVPFVLGRLEKAI